MATKYENILAFFNNSSATPFSVKKLESSLILSTNYTAPSIRKLFILKDVDHTPNFKSVMESFELDMVIWFHFQFEFEFFHEF
jgi:hypothetical protein